MPPSTHAIESALGSLALSGEPIDASALAVALEREVAQRPAENLDFRTRLLIRDSLDAVRGSWGQQRAQDWLTASAGAATLDTIWHADLGEPGFPSLTHRVMETTKTEPILQFFRELALHCSKPTRLEIGGAVAVILAGMLTRHIEDVHVVDEIPLALRSQHELLDQLLPRYGLRLTHFQSHFLPGGWRNHLNLFDRFGELEVFLVDATDIFVGKLFSPRIKDRDDLRAMARHLDKSVVEDRLRQSAAALMAEPRLAQLAADNWYILYAEKLPA